MLGAAQAQRRLERLRLVLGRRVHREVVATDGAAPGARLTHTRVRRPLDVLQLVGLLLRVRRVDERPVQLEGTASLLERQTDLVLLLVGQRRVRQPGGADLLQDLQPTHGALVDDHRLAVLGQDAPARRLGEGVVDDDETLVLGSGEENLVRLALVTQLPGHLDHLVPRARRLGGDAVVVPEQLHVRVLRRGVELAVPLRRLERAGEHVLLGLDLVLARPLLDPPGFGELGYPGHVEAQDVHRRVPRGEPAHHLLALTVGVAGQFVVDDLVASARLLVAVVHDRLEVVFRGVVDVDLHPVARPARGQHRPGHRGGTE